MGQNAVEKIHDWSKALPTKVWLQILGYVHYEHSLTYHQFFKPSYARVNKLFNACATTLSKLPSERSYQFMTYCLVGKITAEKLIDDLKFPSEIQYQHVFTQVCLETSKIFKGSSFKKLEKLVSCINEYNDIKDEVIFRVGKKTWKCQRRQLIEFFLEFDAEQHQALLTLTTDKACHAALMALAYLQKNKSLADIEKLACLYAEMGFLRGSLFIVEFCQGFDVWRDAKNSLESNKNSVLLAVLKSALMWEGIGEYIGRYMVNHYQFYYDLTSLLEIIYACQNFTPATKLLLSDVRHYRSPEALLKVIAAAVPSLSGNNDDFTPQERTKITILNKFIDGFALEFEFDEEESLAIENLLEQATGYEDTMLAMLYDAQKTIVSCINNDASFMPLHLPPALSSMSMSLIEPIGDLQIFFDEHPQVSDNREEFYQEVADLCVEFATEDALTMG